MSDTTADKTVGIMLIVAVIIGQIMFLAYLMMPDTKAPHVPSIEERIETKIDKLLKIQEAK